MWTSLVWIQPHPHRVILRYSIDTVNSFLCSCNNYLENRVLPNDLIVVRNHGDEEDVCDTKDVLENQGDVHTKVEIPSNSELQSLTSSPTRSLGSPCLQINAQDAYHLRYGHSTYA
jgi:hypothetical protein